MDSAIPSFKLPHPTPFNGKRDGFSIIDFLKRMTFFFEGASIAKHRQVVVTLAFAGDSVISWWTLLNKPNTTPFSEFANLLTTEFSPAKFKEHILDLTMKMTMALPLNIANVMAYITKARDYHLLLLSYYTDNPILQDAIRTAFLNGAPPQLRQMLEVAIVNAGDDTTDLPRLFKATEEFGRIFHTDNSSLGAKALAVSGSSAGITNPMAMEIDNISVPTMTTLVQILNSLSIQVNNLARNNQNNNRNHFQRPPNGPTLRRLTPEEKQDLMKNNGCFRCRLHNANHIAKYCPGPISTNNIEMNNEGRSQSGNAPGN